MSHVRVEQCVVLLELCGPRAVPSLLACFLPLLRCPAAEKVGHRDRSLMQAGSFQNKLRAGIARTKYEWRNGVSDAVFTNFDLKVWYVIYII